MDCAFKKKLVNCVSGKMVFPINILNLLTGVSLLKFIKFGNYCNFMNCLDDQYFSKQSDIMNATPGGSITIHCTFHGFDEEPIVKWSFVPAHRPPDGDKFVESFLVSTTVPRNDAKNASLLIPNVLYKHAGQYIVTITHPRTRKQITSSCKCFSTDK